MSSSHKEKVREITKYLTVIIQSLIFTTQQNLYLRGHKEIRIDISVMSHFNRGNILELLWLRCG